MKKAMILLFPIGLFFSGCALNYPPQGIPTSGVRTSIDSSMVMFPIPKANRKVYLFVVNQGRAPNVSFLRETLKKNLVSRGYMVYSSPDQASVEVKVNVLFAGVATMDTAQDVLLQGYQGAVFPAGGIATNPSLYRKTIGESPEVYALIADVNVLERNLAKNRTLKQFTQYNYQARLMSVAPAEKINRSFIGSLPDLYRGFANYLAGIF